MFPKEHFLGNCMVDPRLIGISPLLSPFTANNSSQRLTMFASHLSQAMVLKGSEPPEIGTGFELLVGDYEFDPTARDADIQILAVIPKYIANQGAFHIKTNPSLTVIYRRNDNDKVDYFILNNYTKGSDGYGYKNELMNINLLSENSFVPKEIKFQTSPSHKNNMYAMGVNANVAYMSQDSVTEDAFVISETLANKMESLAICTMDFQVGVNQIPLNLYGTEDEYKFMPDIGEPIREDGIICGFRKPDPVSFVSDTQIDALSKPQHLHDTLYYVQQSGGVILDIDVYVNKKCKIPKDTIFSQIQKYQDQIARYHTAVIQAYVNARQQGYGLTETFNTFVSRSYAFLRADNRRIPDPTFTKKPNITLIQKKDPIEFLYISVTYAYPNKVASGYKFTGRNGDKGVACIIKPDHEMPVDAYGVRADMIVDTATVFNRMNVGQWYVQYLSRTNMFNRWRLLHMLSGGDIRQPFQCHIEDNKLSAPIPPVGDNVDVSSPFNFAMNYIKDINPNYYRMIMQKCINNEKDKIDFVNDIIDKGFFLIIPPFLEHIGSKWILEMNEKYPAPATPVVFITDKFDGSKKINVTKDPIMIGKKYIYCLYRIPKLKASGPGYVNQHKTPIHPHGHAKMQYPVVQTPLRHGEDEIRNQSMAAGPAATARMMALYANSPEGLNMLQRKLIFDAMPSSITRVPISTKELVETNAINRVTQHMFSTFGVDITQSVTENDPRYALTLQMNKPNLALTEATLEDVLCK